MGCGCRKVRKTGITLTASKDLTPEQRQAFRDASIKRASKNVAKTKAARKQQSAVEASRQQICEKCPHAVYNSESSDNKFKVCDKCNRPLFVVCRDVRFFCPLNKFPAVEK